ncbi:MAG: recombination protein RecR [Prevotellaceae bacterium]|nr:recombination protein RecR [Prevotellaceae bacterium]
MTSSYSSALLDRAVNEFAKLPGIGRKTALRLVLHLLKLDEGMVDQFAQSITTLRHDVKHCQVCHNISDDDICAICANPQRDGSIVCVVENFQDVLAIEATTQYHGLYHVLGGVISPMDGISPSALEIDSLVERVSQGNVSEVILALSSTMEGDTTNFYIYRKLQAFDHLNVTMLARGISINDELQYTDEVTLGRSIVNRVPFNIS